MEYLDLEQIITKFPYGIGFGYLLGPFSNLDLLETEDLFLLVSSLTVTSRGVRTTIRTYLNC